MRKRTPAEIEASVKNNDYTGGYEFMPWLVYMRPMALVGLFLNILIGICGFVGGVKSDWLTWALGAGFGLVIPSIIIFMLTRDYKTSKNG